MGPNGHVGATGGASVPLAHVEGHGTLAYDRDRQVFFLDGAPVPLELVRGLDARGLVRWRFLEQRDWVRRLDPELARAAFEREREREDAGLTGRERLEAQIRRHVRKDDSYLHGRIVETDLPPEAPAHPAGPDGAAGASEGGDGQQGAPEDGAPQGGRVRGLLDRLRTGVSARKGTPAARPAGADGAPREGAAGFSAANEA